MAVKRTAGFFAPAELEARRERARQAMAERGLAALLVTSPENVYYLSGLDHQGYFAYQALLLPRDGKPLLITRAMERAIVRDQVPDVEHLGYSDGVEPPAAPEDRERELVLATRTADGGTAGLRPWDTSFGVPSREGMGGAPTRARAPVKATVKALEEAGLGASAVGVEKSGTFLPCAILEGLTAALPKVGWQDASGLVDDLRLVQSPRELECTRRAAALSDTMMLAAIAAAGPGARQRDVMAALYQVMFQRGGTYPGFIPLVRSTHTLEHEHGTWDDSHLRPKDVLFLEMAGCVRRYHAPLGRLVFIGKAPARAVKMLELCRRAIEAASGRIGPGVKAGEVYRAWHACLEEAGLGHYHRHHCGYSVGIGYPPSWSGSGVPVGLRPGSDLALKPGMVFHLMSWLLRTGKGDSFLSDTVVVTDDGCELLTRTPRGLTVR